MRLVCTGACGEPSRVEKACATSFALRRSPAWEVGSARGARNTVPVLEHVRAHAVRAARPERSQDRAGGRGRGPIQSVPHDSPDSPRVLQERSEDAKGSPASVSASSLATALLFVLFLVLSSPEPLFSSDFSVLDARPVPEGFVASLALFFLCGFVPAFVSEVALVLAFFRSPSASSKR